MCVGENEIVGVVEDGGADAEAAAVDVDEEGEGGVAWFIRFWDEYPGFCGCGLAVGAREGWFLGSGEVAG